jgi:hypothetical protein
MKNFRISNPQNEIKEDEIGWTCSTYGEDERFVRGFGGEK